MSRSPVQKLLLVEGETDKFVIPFLMEQNGVQWPKNQHPVEIKSLGSKSVLQDRSHLIAELKSTGLSALGVLIDADQSADSVLQSFQASLNGHADLSTSEFPGKRITTATNGVRFGLWIMPDNQSQGMLETFLRNLIPPGATEDLFQFAHLSTQQAKTEWGAPYKVAHTEKASVHTWLAWQDQPGPRFQEAIRDHMLDAQCDNAKPFVKWFRELFQV